MRKLKGQIPNDYYVEGDIAYILLKNKHNEVIEKALIDAKDLDKVINYGRWYLHCRKDCSTNHVIGNSWIDGIDQGSKLLHLLIREKPNYLMIDHRNGNGLDNRSANLCVVTPIQNSQKRFGADRDSTSGIRGIRWEENRAKWFARIKVSGKTLNLGRYTDKKDAELAVLNARRELFSYDGSLDQCLNLMSTLEHSGVNGPGDRIVVWAQGCPHACPGCFNPQSWNFGIKQLWTPEALALFIKVENPEGLTLSGGEPLSQSPQLLTLMKNLHNNDGTLSFFPKGIICFTGYTMEEIEQIPAAFKCLQYFDLLIDGRFVQSLKYTDALAGSSNQRFHFSKLPGRGEARIKREEVEIDQEVEIHTTDIANEFAITGFPAISRKRLAKLGLKIIS